MDDEKFVVKDLVLERCYELTTRKTFYPVYVTLESEVVAPPVTGTKIRGPTSIFQTNHCYESLIQSYFHYLKRSDDLTKASIVIGADGREFSKEAIQIALEMAAANKIKTVYLGLNGLTIESMVSCLIQRYKCVGGIYLTGSSSPANIFGIMLYDPSAACLSDVALNLICVNSTTLSKFLTLSEKLNLPLQDFRFFEIPVGQSIYFVNVLELDKIYYNILDEVFEFKTNIAPLLSGRKPKCRVIIDCMHGASGPFLKYIFSMMGVPLSNLINSEPRPDLGNERPTVRWRHRKFHIRKYDHLDYDLLAFVGATSSKCLICARNGTHIDHGHSLAVFAKHCHAIPPYNYSDFHGFGKTFLTNQSIYFATRGENGPITNTPFSWKNLEDLIINEEASICADVNSGLGGAPMKDRDSFWVVLAWLCMVRHLNKTPLQILDEHWRKYGKSKTAKFTCAFTDEERLEALICSLDKKIPTIPAGSQITPRVKVLSSEIFEFREPWDGGNIKPMCYKFEIEGDELILMGRNEEHSLRKFFWIYGETRVMDPTFFKVGPEVLVNHLLEAGIKISDVHLYHDNPNFVFEPI